MKKMKSKKKLRRKNEIQNLTFMATPAFSCDGIFRNAVLRVFEGGPLIFGRGSTKSGCFSFFR